MTSKYSVCCETQKHASFQVCCCLSVCSSAVIMFEPAVHEQVKEPRTMLAYESKANANATIDLSNALRAAGLPCSGCVDACFLLTTCPEPLISPAQTDQF